MVRGFSFLLGVGLIALWFVALGSPVAAPWLTWLLGVAALGSFAISAAGSEFDRDKRLRSSAPIALSLALFGLWITAFATNVVSWMTWWTFAFACCYLVLGVAASGTRASSEAESPFKDQKRAA